MIRVAELLEISASHGILCFLEWTCGIPAKRAAMTTWSPRQNGLATPAPHRDALGTAFALPASSVEDVQGLEPIVKSNSVASIQSKNVCDWEVRLRPLTLRWASP